MTFTRYCGIDPGVTGAIVILNEAGGLEEAIVMPNEADLVKVAKTLRNAFVTIEDPSPNPAWGVASAWGFARHIGYLQGTFPWAVRVRPQAWQKDVWMKELVEGKKCPKEKSHVMAKTIWPLVDWRATARSRNPHDGLVDAALIAYWGLKHGSQKVQSQAG